MPTRFADAYHLILRESQAKQWWPIPRMRYTPAAFHRPPKWFGQGGTYPPQSRYLDL